MTLVRANPLGWGLFELLTSAQINVIDSQLPYAMDGRGGDYTLLEGFGLDGTAVTAEPTLAITSGATSTPAMQVINGGTGVVLDLQSLDTTGDNSLLHVHGDDLSVSFVGHAARIEARRNALGDGEGGLHLTGGDAIGGPSTFGGDGLSVQGGSGSGGYSPGGRAIYAQGGSSYFESSAGSPQYGVAAVKVVANYTYGADAALHYGSPAAEFYGSETEGGGKGGPGVYAEGGLGSSNVVGGADAGAGVVGLGGSGIVGISAGLTFSFRPPPAEFSQSARAAVRAMAKNAGRGILSEVSGSPSDQELNLFKWAGTVTSPRTLLKLDASPDNVPPGGTSVGLNISSGVNAGLFRAAQFSSREATALQLSTLPGAGGVNYYPTLNLLSQSPPPNQMVVGSLCTIASTAGLAGLSASTVFIGHGSSTNYYDRVVGSADSAAAWAWARIRTNGSGGVTLVSDYGCASVAFNGTTAITLTLDTVTGGPTNPDNMVAVGSSNNTAGFGGDNTSGWVQVLITDTTHLNISVYDDGAIDLTTETVDISVIVHAMPTYGRPATRPTFYRVTDL